MTTKQKDLITLFTGVFEHYLDNKPSYKNKTTSELEEIIQDIIAKALPVNIANCWDSDKTLNIVIINKIIKDLTLHFDVIEYDTEIKEFLLFLYQHSDVKKKTYTKDMKTKEQVINRLSNLKRISLTYMNISDRKMLLNTIACLEWILDDEIQKHP